MSTPVDERFDPLHNANIQRNPSTHLAPGQPQRSSDDDTTYVEGTLSHEDSPTRGGDVPTRQNTQRGGTHLGVNTTDFEPGIGRMPSLRSPSTAREQTTRLDDDLAMLQVERAISAQDAQERSISHTRSLKRERSRHDEPIDEFDVATNPLHETAAIYKPPENPTNKVAKFFKKVHGSVWIIRYLTYIAPLVLILLIPLLCGAFAFPDADVGGVSLMWFCIWLEIVWLTLWAGRILAKCLPWPIGIIASLFTNNGKKWRDMGKQLELPATLFFWWLAIEISFLPTMTNHHVNGDKSTKSWQNTMNKVLVSVFVGFILNFVEKIIIQLIAISFHLRTYADRIEINKFQIGSLAKLYKFSKEKIKMEDSDFEEAPSGAKTPGQLVKDAQKNTREVFSKFGDIAGKVAGDFTGKQVTASTHPQQVVLELLRSSSGAQVLARRLYRTFARPETDTVVNDDLRNAFDNDEEADAAFSMFDKDMNGDISMEELEAVCVELGQERKSITASLKDLDSVVSKLDDVFMFLVFVITILVFISLISTSAAGVLTSAGSAVLALSWLFSATAQEFLQSIVFVFVKHPFDVGDRVTIYGNTGATGTGDDYFVKEIALLYTEFKKMEGHVVQAPNSYLNTLFILNQRRSGGLAEAIPNVIKFGTTLEQIESLRNRLLEFVRSEKREYQPNILTELKGVTEVHQLSLNVVFFYKSNWQNELLRLQRRNKFICALMIAMQECGIEGPRMRYPGQKESFPIYMQNLPHTATPGMGHNGTPDAPQGLVPFNRDQPPDEPFVPAAGGDTGNAHTGNAHTGNAHLARSHPSILRHPGDGGRARAESMAAMGKRVDFSLGMKDMSQFDMPGDVFEDRESEIRRRKTVIRVTSPSGNNSMDRARGSQDTGRSSALHTVTTDSTQARERPSHRNRFFNRSRHEPLDEETGAGMADIPEADSNQLSRQLSRERLDGRSGTVSPTAIRMSEGETFVPRASGAMPVSSGSMRSGTSSFHAPRRSQTDNIEMRHFH